MQRTAQALDELTEIHDALAAGSANDAWLSRARSATRRYFGEGSEEHMYFQNFRFTPSRGVVTKDWKERVNRHKAKKVEEAKQFIQDCISTIRRHGVYQEPTPPTPQPAVSVTNIQQQGDGSAVAAQSSSASISENAANHKTSIPIQIAKVVGWILAAIAAIATIYQVLQSIEK